MTEWFRYAVHFPTDEQLENFSGPITLADGREVVLLAQTDTSSVYGIADPEGRLLVTEAGCMYQAETDFYARLNDLVSEHGCDIIPDTYAQDVIVQVPWDVDANAVLAALERMTVECIREYNPA